MLDVIFIYFIGIVDVFWIKMLNRIADFTNGKINNVNDLKAVNVDAIQDHYDVISMI